MGPSQGTKTCSLFLSKQVQLLNKNKNEWFLKFWDTKISLKCLLEILLISAIAR